MFCSCGPHLSGPIDHFIYVTLHKTPSLSLRENRIWQRSREAFEADAADRHQGGSGMTQTYDLVCIQCGTPLETGLRTGEVAEADGRRLTQALLRGCAVCAESGIKRSEEHTSELQSRENLVCRLLLEKKKTTPDRE